MKTVMSQKGAGIQPETGGIFDMVSSFIGMLGLGGAASTVQNVLQDGVVGSASQALQDHVETLEQTADSIGLGSAFDTGVTYAESAFGFDINADGVVQGEE